MSSVDSVAVFMALVEKLGLGTFIPKFIENGWTTHGIFAFAANYKPGFPDDSALRDEVLVRLTDGDRDHPIMASVRRLHFESFTQFTEAAKRMSGQRHDSMPLEIPAPERSARLEILRESLPGVRILGDLVPSDVLTDKFADMQQRGTLLYLPWVELGRRDLEMQLGNKGREEYWKKNAAGILCEHSYAVDAPADISTALKLHKALQRRGFAMQMANLLTYKSHELLTAWLSEEFQREPLPGYHSITLEQVELADKQVFMRLSEISRGFLAPHPEDGSMPLDHHMPIVLADYRIIMLLAPTKIAVTMGESRGTKRGLDDDGALDKMRKENQRLQQALAASKADKRGAKVGGGKAKGGGKGGAGKKTATMPKELEGMEATWKGKRICFGFNMKSGCSLKVKNGECDKGLHVCALSKCHGSNHGAQHRDCPERE